MHGLRLLFQGLGACLAAGLSVLALAAAPPPEGIVIDILAPGYDPAYQGFRQQIEQQRQAWQDTIRLRTRLDTPTIADDRRHLLITLGNQAWLGLEHIPAHYEAVLAVHVDPAHYTRQLAAMSAQHAAQGRPLPPTSALFRGAPMARQLRLARLLLPRATDLAAPHADDTEATATADELAALAKTHGFAVHAAALPETDSPIPVLQSLLRHSDAVLALPELKAFQPQSVRSLLLTTYRQGRPVIGMDPAYVQAGILATTYTPPAAYAEAAEQAVRHWLTLAQWPPADYPAGFAVMLNQQVARSLDLVLPDEATLLQALQAAEGAR